MPGVFSRHAAAYDDRLRDALDRGEARGRTRVVALLQVRPGDRVLDLGCGPGVLLRPLAEAVGDTGLVVGVDLAEGMLALARAGAPPWAAVTRMDMERLGVASGAFDAVACGHALQFCPDLGLALAEARRALRDGGRFAASLPAAAGRGRGSAGAARILDEVFARRLPPAPEPTDAGATRAVLRDRARIRTALRAAGFRSVAIERVAEVSSYAGPEALVDRTLRWWTCAWRLEALPEPAREALRAEAVAALRARLGAGPVTVPGATWVLSGVR
ncbi:MAG TPA: methyltransferase domain-containing protein [Candidatus Dormibacteraeota bacterium]